MHRAKGLEFRAVVVMACDDEVIRSKERIEAAADDSDLDEAHKTERHISYVACTHARDYLLVSGVNRYRDFWTTLPDGVLQARNGRANRPVTAHLVDPLEDRARVEICPRLQRSLFHSQ
jgi:superfamily I DNA/RNA helicase